MLLIPFVSHLWVQLVPQQKGGVARPQMTLAQPPVMTLQGPTHSRIIVGQLHTGEAQHSLGWLCALWDGQFSSRFVCMCCHLADTATRCTL